MIDCKSRPVIFPKLAREVVCTEGRLIVTGRKRADFKLLELLISTDDLPHVMAWDAKKKQWNIYPDGSELQIMDDVIVKYDYEKVHRYDDALLLSWLNLYSSSSFAMINSRDKETLAAIY